MIYDRISFFKEMNLTNEQISKYKNFKFTKDEVTQLEELIKVYKIERHFNFSDIKKICNSEIFLGDNIMLSLIIYLIEKGDYSFLDLFNEKISEKSFADNEFKRQIFLSMEQVESLHLTLEDILGYCHTIFKDTNDITFYRALSQYVSDKLLEDIKIEFLTNPNRKLNYLIIFCLEKRDMLYKFIEEYQVKGFEETLFLIQSCFEISKSDKKLAYRIVREKLITKVKLDVVGEDNALLIGNYSNLLFMLLLNNNDEAIVNEISKITEQLGESNIESIIYLIYREQMVISKECAECLYSIIILLSDKKTKQVKYPISHIYSLLEDSIFLKFCIPILSIIGIEEHDSILSRIENNSGIFLKDLLQIALEMNQYFNVAIKVIKHLYKKKKMSLGDLKEDYYLRLLRIFHCYEIDADFICDISIDLFLNTRNENIQKELYDYILTSIYDNYFLSLIHI